MTRGDAGVVCDGSCGFCWRTAAAVATCLLFGVRLAGLATADRVSALLPAGARGVTRSLAVGPLLVASSLGEGRCSEAECGLRRAPSGCRVCFCARVAALLTSSLAILSMCFLALVKLCAAGCTRAVLVNLGDDGAGVCLDRVTTCVTDDVTGLGGDCDAMVLRVVTLERVDVCGATRVGVAGDASAAAVVVCLAECSRVRPGDAAARTCEACTARGAVYATC